MKLSIRTLILLICIVALVFGSCTKLKTISYQKSDEDSVTGDSGNTNDTTLDTADSAKRANSSRLEDDSVQGDSGDVNTSTLNNTDSGEPLDASSTDLDASSTDSKQTDSDTGTEEIKCGSDELSCNNSCVPNDEKNCGECGHDCTALEHVTGSVDCDDGKCVLTSSSCESGWYDCNEDSEDGCETNITDAKNCGSCGNDCSETTKSLCTSIEGDDRYECTADCHGDGEQIALATGYFHVCALYGGSVKCWGDNKYGQLGYGDTEDRGDQPNEMGSNLPAVDLSNGSQVRAISSGRFHSCALMDNGSIKCWGRNDHGQLGLGHTDNVGDQSTEMGDNLPEVDLGGLSALQVSCGHYFTCALLEDHSLKCWGRNENGQLGLGDTDDRGDDPLEMGSFLPAIDLGGQVSAISTGGVHVCARLMDDSIKCWGSSKYAQLGLGDLESRGDDVDEMGAFLDPLDFGLGYRPVNHHCGNTHSCATFENGRVKCWGNSIYGMLGQGDTDNLGDESGEMGDFLPAAPLDMDAIVAIPGRFHTCAMSPAHAIKCWGRNEFGQLGYGDTNDRDQLDEMGGALPLVDVGTNRSACSLHVNGHITCVVLSNNGVKCWGQNTDGQLGQGDTSPRGDQSGEMGDALTDIELWP